MNIFDFIDRRLFIGFVLTWCVFTAPVTAQDVSAQYGNVIVSVGAGITTLDLPDVQLIKTIPAFAGGQTVNGRSTTAEDFSDEMGLNINGSISAHLTSDRMVSLNGFWANIKDTDASSCVSEAGAICIVNALVVNPATLFFFGAGGIGSSIDSVTKRNVNQAAVSLEIKQFLPDSNIPGSKLFEREYFALGADWRTINQDLSMRSNLSASANFDLTYNEKLDTDYFGVFAAIGGNYKPFLLAGLWDSLGLKSSFRLQGGIYHADTDYKGSMRETLSAVPTILDSDATDQHNEITFIGGLTLETTAQLNRRITLSLKSTYEYYSYVPSMNYNDNVGTLTGANVGTTIGYDDAYSMSTSLRLTIKLGPDDVLN